MDSDHSHPNDEAMTATDLASLIAHRKGARSYERLASDCGGVVTAARLHQLAKGKITRFSDPDVISGLAQGLGTTVTEVVAAMSRSLGLDVRYGQDPHALVIGGAGALPDRAQEVVASVARELLAAYKVADTTKEVGRDGDAAAMNEAGETPAADNVRPFRRADERDDETGTTVPVQERAVANEDDTLEDEGIAQLEDP
ncbi:hypothetical protein ACWHA6_36200 [Streptomyces anthocyanicus]